MKRNQGIDLLRIILALMVLALHFNAGLGKVEENAADLSLNWCMIWFVESLCYVAVNCYILVSGYFDANSEMTFKKVTKRLIALWSAMIFYSLIEYFVLSAAFGNQIRISDLIERCFPLSSKEWWFMTNYFIVVLLSPILQNGSKIIDDHSMQSIWLILLIAFCIIPQFQLWEDSFGLDHGYGVIWFLYVYITGSLIYRFENNKKLTENKIMCLFSKKPLNGYFLVVSLLFSSKLIIAIASNRLFGEVKYSGLLYSYNSILVLFSSVFLFLYFKNIDFTSDYKLLSKISSMSMASYLVHCQTDFRTFIWGSLKLYRYSNSILLPLVFICCLLCFFCLSIFLELIRLEFINIFKSTNQLSKNINNKL